MSTLGGTCGRHSLCGMRQSSPPALLRCKRRPLDAVMCELMRGAHSVARELSPCQIVEGAMALQRFLCIVRVPRQLRCAANTVIGLTACNVGQRRGAVLRYVSCQQVGCGSNSLCGRRATAESRARRATLAADITTAGLGALPVLASAEKSIISIRRCTSDQVYVPCSRENESASQEWGGKKGGNRMMEVSKQTAPYICSRSVRTVA